MRNLILIIFSIVSLVSAQKTNPDISGTDIFHHISFLASDSLEGRYSGSDGNAVAAKYIENYFRSYNLEPLFENSFFQQFEFIDDVELDKNNAAELILPNEKLKLVPGKDYQTLSVSGSAEINASLFFAGYGISSGKLDYDDYKDIDVKNKIVIVLRYSPDYNESHSKFDEFSSIRYKASTAKLKGAAGIVIINNFSENGDDELIEFHYDRSPGIEGFPVIQVKRKFIDKIFSSNKLDLTEIESEINKNITPKSFVLNNSQFSIKTELKTIKKTTSNVVGLLRGNDDQLKNEYIVIGAHFDHLGYGKYGSLYRGEGEKIHNGADDNASGTSGMLELAEYFSSNKSKLKRSIIFIAFSGEELGLLGSNFFVNNSPVPLDQISSMINMDMIGRLNKDRTLNIIGSGTTSIWEGLLKQYNNYSFNLSFTDDGFGGSDHQSFTIKKIPVLFFFTGTHSDYHKPSDDTEKINIDGEKDIVDFISQLILDIQDDPTKPNFIQVAQKSKKGGMKSKIYVGTVPEFGYQGKGYKISGVSEDSPAEKGGMMGNDIIIKMGNKDIGNIYDFMYASNEYSPGDEVEFVVLRNEKKVKLKIIIGSK